ncbi:MAG: hypothetical protein R3A47_04575 [Polyangiales bacterium]
MLWLTILLVPWAITSILTGLLDSPYLKLLSIPHANAVVREWMFGVDSTPDLAQFGAATVVCTIYVALSVLIAYRRTYGSANR